ncbi:hypothetical protein QF035_010449 [Streptomyces umbrinus]|uniref:Uncharacterized protein n=1 Tax=Streptomyces umbrinus TaxID=67370 RepID=A0ABU0TAN2_9ACTN|nr:hypothetical protein [Streptomyces umbrinus]
MPCRSPAVQGEQTGIGLDDQPVADQAFEYRLFNLIGKDDEVVDLGLDWSAVRRGHQADARRHHFKRRLRLQIIQTQLCSTGRNAPCASAARPLRQPALQCHVGDVLEFVAAEAAGGLDGDAERHRHDISGELSRVGVARKIALVDGPLEALLKA